MEVCLLSPPGLVIDLGIPCQLLWTFDAGGPIFSAPAVGLVQAALNPEHFDNNNLTSQPGALDFELRSKKERPEERIFFTSQAGQLFCVLSSNGKLCWHQPAEVRHTAFRVSR